MLLHILIYTTEVLELHSLEYFHCIFTTNHLKNQIPWIKDHYLIQALKGPDLEMDFLDIGKKLTFCRLFPILLQPLVCQENRETRGSSLGGNCSRAGMAFLFLYCLGSHFVVFLFKHVCLSCQWLAILKKQYDHNCDIFPLCLVLRSCLVTKELWCYLIVLINSAEPWPGVSANAMKSSLEGCWRVSALWSIIKPNFHSLSKICSTSWVWCQNNPCGL